MNEGAHDVILVARHNWRFRIPFCNCIMPNEYEKQNAIGIRQKSEMWLEAYPDHSRDFQCSTLLRSRRTRKAPNLRQGAPKDLKSCQPATATIRYKQPASGNFKLWEKAHEIFVVDWPCIDGGQAFVIRRCVDDNCASITDTPHCEAGQRNGHSRISRNST